MDGGDSDVMSVNWLNCSCIGTGVAAQARDKGDLGSRYVSPGRFRFAQQILSILRQSWR